MAKRTLCLFGMLTLLTVTGVEAQDRPRRPAPPPPGKQPPPNDRWRAWAVTEGKDARLVVEGIVADGGAGKVAVVTPANPQGFDPKILMLNVSYASLPGNWPAIAQPIPAGYVVSPYKADTHTSVTIRYPDGSVYPIKSVVDAGAGPKGH